MGHRCKICNRIRPNEKFSGKGHKMHICKECKRKPKEEIVAIQDEEEILGFLEQSNISKLNIKRLNVLNHSDNKKVSELAEVVLAIAKIKPHKKKRVKFISRENPPLLIKMKELGLIEDIY